MAGAVTWCCELEEWTDGVDTLCDCLGKEPGFTPTTARCWA